MRQIKTREEIERREKRNKKIIGFFFIFIMILSTAGYAFFSYGGGNQNNNNLDNSSQNHNGRYWVQSVGGQEFYFTNDLDAIRNVSVSISNGLGDYVGSDIFVDSDNELAFNEVGINLARNAGRFQKACYGNCDEDLPEKNCDSNLIIFKESQEEKVYQEQKCIFIEGRSDLKSVDAFLYKIVGLI